MDLEEEELQRLAEVQMNVSKSTFENKTVKDIESKYTEGSCEYSIW